jgi:hypothetical protein
MTATPSPEKLQAMLDREEIRQLTESYCHYVWQKDSAIADLFTEDGAFVGNAKRPETAVRGREALKAEYARILDRTGPKPFIHNHVITFEGPDRATGFCYLDVRIVIEGQPQNRLAYYNDTYLRVDGAWRFKERVCNWVMLG